ncbi:hypothetical protein Xbed_00190 [Xenorhabdus beddingii]|uniref:Uncharacterized protein n=1 Tax=Xenorhabdus beddingii TaxID=40578 RepID=A0A1Y2SVP2_9GAMM|nr:helix-turn-helix domain-containing protein [Xenorhabdus beddingii]OTA21941.1 hypothetical protein Xbed_00190 [Xenorhabdus beddingii]
MPEIHSKDRHYRQLTLGQKCRIEALYDKGFPQRDITKSIGLGVFIIVIVPEAHTRAIIQPEQTEVNRETALQQIIAQPNATDENHTDALRSCECFISFFIDGKMANPQR